MSIIAEFFREFVPFFLCLSLLWCISLLLCALMYLESKFQNVLGLPFVLWVFLNLSALCESTYSIYGSVYSCMNVWNLGRDSCSPCGWLYSLDTQLECRLDDDLSAGRDTHNPGQNNYKDDGEKKLFFMRHSC